MKERNNMSIEDIEKAVKDLSPVTTPVIYNKTMTTADTEYMQELPSDTRKFVTHCRDGTEFRLAFVAGKVATPTAPYLTIKANSAYSEDNIKSVIKLHFACASAGKVIETVAWN